jgi:TolB-like protein
VGVVVAVRRGRAVATPRERLPAVTHGAALGAPRQDLTTTSHHRPVDAARADVTITETPAPPPSPPESPPLAIAEGIPLEIIDPRSEEVVEPRWMAVLPFENASTDPENEFLGEGIAEEILNALARLPALRVAGRTSAFSFRTPHENLQDIARQLNVETVLAGTVRDNGDRVLIEPQLIDTSAGRQIWSEQYARERADLVRVADEIAGVVAARLAVRPGGRATARLPNEHVDDPEAYRLFLKGRQLLARLQEPYFSQAIEAFEGAIALAPDYARAYAALAECQIIRAVVLDEPYSASPTQARAAAEKALELNDQIPEAHAVLGLILTYYDLDWDRAEREFERALELGADSAWVHTWYGDLLAATRRFDESVEQARLAQRIEPLAPLFRWNVVQNLWLGARLDEAHAEAAAALELYPDVYVLHVFTGLIAWSKGSEEDALAALERAVDLAGGDPTFTAVLTAACYYFAVQPRAELLFATLQDRAERGHISAAWVALIHLCRNDSNAAIRWLRTGRENGDAFYAMFRVCIEALHIPIDRETETELDRLGFA